MILSPEHQYAALALATDKLITTAGGHRTIPTRVYKKAKAARKQQRRSRKGNR